MAKRPRRKVDRTAPAGEVQWVFVLLVATGFAPYLVHVPQVMPFSARFAGILLSAAAWVTAWAMRPDVFALDRRLVLASAAVAAVTVVSAALSEDPGTSLTYGFENVMMGASSWLGLLAVFVLVSGIALDKNAAEALSTVFVWGVPTLLVGVSKSATTSATPGAGFGNGNYWGAVMLTLAPLALALGALEDRPQYRRLWRLGGIAFLAGAFFSKSANVMAAAVLQALAIGVAFPDAVHPSLGRHRKAFRWLALAVVCLALVAVGLYLSPDVAPGFKSFVDDDVLGLTATTRVEMWKAGLAAFADRPLLGAGPDVLPLATQRHLSELLMSLEAREIGGFHSLIPDPHSLPVLVLGSLGIAGLLSLVWLAFEWVRQFRRRIADDDRDHARARLLLALSTASFLVVMLFMPWTVGFGPLPVLVAALAVSPALKTLPRQVAAPRVSWRRLGPAMAVLVAAVVLSVTALAGAYMVVKADSATRSADSLAWFEKAARLQPTRTYLRYEQLYVTGKMLGEGVGTIEAYRAAVDRAPSPVRAYGGYLANLVQVALDKAYLDGRSDLEWERETLAEAEASSPNHPEVVLERAHLELVAGRPEAAAPYIARAQVVAAQNLRLHLYEYYLAVLEGEEEKAGELSRKVYEQTPGFVPLLSQPSQPSPAVTP